MINLKKIEMKGFKSFADRTEIFFDNNVTAIVGPNGCGKSNVVDAIRWVFGESRTKELRASKEIGRKSMIFAGTDKRPAHSFCEVSLYFDNSKRIFDIDLDEIVFTRQMFKDGSNEYQINREKRLYKEFSALLMNTGLGGDGYSVVTQNDRERIIEGSQKERRKIFEEAAGITLMRKQKEKSEKEIADAEINLVEARTRVKGLEDQIRPLEKKVAAKRRYDALRAEMQRLEVNDFLIKYESSDEKKQKLVDTLKGLKTTIYEKDNESRVLNREYEQARFDVHKYDEEIDKLTEERHLLVLNQANISGDQRSIGERLKGMENQEETLNQSLETYKLRKESNEMEIRKLVASRDEKNTQLLEKKQELENLEARLKELRAELSIGEDAQSSATDMIQVSYEELLSIKENLSANKSLMQARTESTETLKIELERIRALYEEAKTEYEVLDAAVGNLTKRVVALSEAFNEANSEQRDTSAAIEAYTEDINKLKADIAEAESRLTVMVQVKQNYDMYPPALKRLLDAAKTDKSLSSRIRGTVAELISVPQELSEAIEVALGNSATQLVVNTADDAKVLAEYMRRNSLGRYTFLPIDSMKRRTLDPRIESILDERGVAEDVAAELIDYDPVFYNVISNLLGATVIADNANIGLSLAKKYGFNVRIVTKDGNMYQPSGAISGGSRSDSSKDKMTLLEQEKRIAAMKESIETKKTQLNKVISAWNNSKVAFEELRKKVQDTLSEHGEAQAEAAEARKKRDIVLTNMNRYQLELTEKQLSFDKHSKELAELKEKIKQAEALEVKAQSKRTATDEASKKKLAETQELRKQYEECTSKSTMLGIDTATLSTTISNIKVEIERLELDNGVCETGIAEAVASLEYLVAEIKKNRDALENIQISPEDQKRADALLALIEERRAVKQEAFDRMSQLDAEKSKLAGELEVLREQATKAEFNVDRFEREMLTLGDYILGEYGLDYEAAKELRDEEFSGESITAEVRNIKSEITKLGDINHAALAEYEELAAQFGDEMAILDDMEKSRQGIEEILAALTSTMTERFITTFNAIALEYEKMFRLLFNGGKASLTLDLADGDTPLDAGIIIKAVPPGRKVESVVSLSGGERALTVIAILLAITKVKPTPFCVFDEVEAPLDDTNCRIFGECLQSFSNYTQFIVITHKRPTMEVADALFGVTMLDPGVSNVVSVTLADGYEIADKHEKEEAEKKAKAAKSIASQSTLVKSAAKAAKSAKNAAADVDDGEGGEVS